MKQLLVIPFVIIILALLLALYFFLQILYAKHLTELLKAHTVPYSNESDDTKKTLLVIGDSTAVGIGASTTTDSIPSLVAKKISATYTENYAISGSVVSSLASQIKNAKRAHYSLILVQIGANDIVARHDVIQITNDLKKILIELSKRGDRIVVVTAGNIGGAPAIPFLLHP